MDRGPHKSVLGHRGTLVVRKHRAETTRSDASREAARRVGRPGDCLQLWALSQRRGASCRGPVSHRSPTCHPAVLRRPTRDVSARVDMPRVTAPGEGDATGLDRGSTHSATSRPTAAGGLMWGLDDTLRAASPGPGAASRTAAPSRRTAPSPRSSGRSANAATSCGVPASRPTIGVVARMEDLGSRLSRLDPSRVGTVPPCLPAMPPAVDPIFSRAP